MSQFVTGKTVVLAKELSECERTIKAIRSDVASYLSISAAAMGAKNAEGADLPIDERVLSLLRNSKVNDLAGRYLRADFNRDAAVLFEQVKKAYSEEKRYRDAIETVDNLYAKNVGDTAQWLKMTSVQREREKNRLTHEIERLESKRSSLLKDVERLTKGKLQGGRRNDTERSERLTTLQYKINDMANEITKKRDQLDVLVNPDANRNVETRAVREKQETQRRENTNRDRSLRDIERTMKPKRTVVEVVIEFEQKTLAALQAKMDADLKIAEQQLNALREQSRQLGEAKLLIPISTKDELIQMKKTLRSL